MSKHSWATMGETRQGAYHAQKGVVNQDAVAYWSNGPGESAGIVVCDGLGSRPHSHLGSRAVANGFLDFLFIHGPRMIEKLAAKDPVQTELVRRLIAAHIALTIGEVLKREGDALGLKGPMDLCCTMVFAFATGDGRIICGQQGDSALIAVRKDGTAKMVFPECEWEMNATTTVVDRDFASALRLMIAGTPEEGEHLAGFVAMSDGAESGGLAHWKTREAAPANAQMVEALAGGDFAEARESFSAFADLLRSKQHDDTTFAVLARR